MAEGAANVRVVRCPKCDNLLAELPDYPVYKCGGCGAVLLAKNKTPATDGSSEKSDDERVKGDSEKLDGFSEKVGVNLSDYSETDKESEGVGRNRRRDRILRERGTNSNGTSSSRTENRELASDFNSGGAVETMNSRFDGDNGEKETGYVGRYRRFSKAPVDNWDLANDQDMKKNRAEAAKASMVQDVGGIPPKIGDASGSSRSGQIPDWRTAEIDGMTAFRRNPRAFAEGMRFSSTPYPDEGPSNYHPGPSYGFNNGVKNENLDVNNRVEYLEQDRVELLRKLDELKDQLSRSCDVADKPKEKVPIDRRMIPPDPYGGRSSWLTESSSGPNRASVQSFMPDKHFDRPHYFNHGHEPVPLMNRHDVDAWNFYPPLMHDPNEIGGYGDPFASRIPRSVPPPPRPYPQRASHEYFSGQYMDIDHDLLASYPHNTFFHQPACSCVHCCNKHWQAPTSVPPAFLYNRRFNDAPTNPSFFHPENPGIYGAHAARVCNPIPANPPPSHSREPQPNTRRPSDLDSEIGGIGQGHLRRTILAKGNKKLCRPVAGGAPFITCRNCFELLQLPKKLLVTEKNVQKLRCGGCSTIISFGIENKRLVVSVLTQNKKSSPEVDDGYGEVVNKRILHSHGHANQGSMNSFDDYDHSGYNFQSMDAEPVLSSKDQRLNSGETEKMQDFLSSSSSTSEDEESPDGAISPRVVSSSAERPLKATVTPPLPGSPLQEHFDYSSNNHAINRFGKGNKSKRLDEEKVIPIRGTSRQNSVKDVPSATEMEVSFNEYSNTGLSHDSEEISKEENGPRIHKGAESFFAGLIKKSFKELSRSNPTAENGKSNVTINGHSIPDRLIKKAEKQAGPILPGQYWYDFRAGFWGVMGNHCLGIIPPFIEEFNYPMSEDCAGGNTGIFVNGRELHQKDLDLLSSRGLATTRDKSYIVEISGKVLDEDTGEVLDSLGKLAPTVERAKHGFGMRVPKVAT